MFGSLSVLWIESKMTSYRSDHLSLRTAGRCCLRCPDRSCCRCEEHGKGSHWGTLGEDYFSDLYSLYQLLQGWSLVIWIDYLTGYCCSLSSTGTRKHSSWSGLLCRCGGNRATIWEVHLLVLAGGSLKLFFIRTFLSQKKKWHHSPIDHKRYYCFL